MKASGLEPQAAHRRPASAAVSQRVRAAASSPEELVVVEIVDGTANQTVVHQPIHPNRFRAFDFPPATWAGKCGVAGSVYRHAGMFEDVPVCAVCLALK